MPAMLAAEKAEIRKILVQSQPGKISCKTLSQRNPTQNRVGRVA
jgi:hypothetical protein